MLSMRRARYRHPTKLVRARRAADVVKARGGGSRPVTGRAYSKLNKRTANQTKATKATIAGPICHLTLLNGHHDRRAASRSRSAHPALLGLQRAPRCGLSLQEGGASRRDRGG
jgi:hypothetical protein